MESQWEMVVSGIVAETEIMQGKNIKGEITSDHHYLQL